MDENEESKLGSAVKDVAKQGAKSLGNMAVKKVAHWAAPVIGWLLAILLAAGVINAIPHLIIYTIRNALFGSDTKTTQVAVGTYDNTILGAAEQVYQEQKDWTYYTDFPGDYEKDQLPTLKAPVEIQLNNPDKSTCCASYVSCVLYASGYFTSAEIGYNFAQPHVVEEILKSANWQRIDNLDEIEAGDIVFCDHEGNTTDSNNTTYEHVEIYAGNNEFYSSSQKISKAAWKSGYAYLWAYRPIDGPKNDPPMKYSSSDQLIVLGDDGKYKLSVENLAEIILQELQDQKVDNEQAQFVTDTDTDTDTNADDVKEPEEGFTPEQLAELQDMIDKYIKVEANTTLPHIYDKWFHWLERLTESHIDGMIKVKRQSADGKITDLTYRKLSEFEKLGDDIYNHYSLTEDFELCIARKGDFTTYHDVDGKKVKTEGKSRVIEKIPYRSYIENYTTPFNFLISLHMIAQDKDFMEEVVKLALGENKEETVVLTYVERNVEAIKEIEFDGEIINRTITNIKLDDDTNVIQTIDGEKADKKVIDKKTEITNSNLDTIIDKSHSEYPEYFKTIKNSTGGKLYVTKADTWLVYNEITLTEKPRSSENETSKKIIGSENNHEWGEIIKKTRKCTGTRRKVANKKDKKYSNE